MRLSSIALAITAIYGGFSPSALFANGEQGTWYDPSDLSTLFQDSAGTTPVTGVEQVVGLMLDKSKGLVLGPELVTNGTFATDLTGWTADVGASAVRDTTIFTGGGMLVTANGASNSYATQTLTGLTAGRRYVLSASVYTPSTNATNNRATIGIQAASFSATGSRAQSALNTVQTLSISFVAVATTQTIYMSVVDSNFASWGTAGSVGYFDNISVRELPGNHATSTGAARPTLSARVNLLTYSEEFNNGVWFPDGVTVSANNTTDPLGGNTAKIIVENSATSEHRVYRDTPARPSIVSGAQYTLSFYIKYIARQYIQANLGSRFGSRVIFDIQNGAVTDVSTADSASITPVGNGWYRCVVVDTATSTGTESMPIGGNSTSTGNNSSYAGLNGNAFAIWGAQLLTAADAFATGNAYQRIAAATVYDTSNSVFRPYLLFGGTQAMSTGSIDFTATDKMSVFAGVRKLSDSFYNAFAELSGDPTNNGIFLVGNNGSAPGGYFFRSRGTNSGTALIASGFTVPITNVVTGNADISGDSAILRVNGTQVAQSTTDQGTGNYGNYPLFIGARNLASAFLNGRLYSLITRGAQSTAAEISATESWVNGKTAAF